MVALLLAVIISLSYLYVWQRIYSLQLADEASAHRAIVKLLEEKCRTLEFEVAELRSLSRIQDVAQKNLMMSPLRQEQLVKLLDNYGSETFDAGSTSPSTNLPLTAGVTSLAGEKK
jgi:cell division protein FtsL